MIWGTYSGIQFNKRWCSLELSATLFDLMDDCGLYIYITYYYYYYLHATSMFLSDKYVVVVNNKPLVFNKNKNPCT